MRRTRILVCWALLWLASVRERDVRRQVIQTDEHAAGTGLSKEIQEIPLWKVFVSKRWLRVHMLLVLPKQWINRFLTGILLSIKKKWPGI